MLVFRYTRTALTTLEGVPVSKASIVAYASACEAVGLAKPTIRLVFSPEVQEELKGLNVSVWDATRLVGERLGLKTSYQLVRGPKVPAVPEAPSADDLATRFAGLV